MLTHAALIGRIAAGAALGGVIGYERHRHGRRLDAKKKIVVTLEVRLPTSVGLARLIERLESHPGVRRIQAHAPS